MRRETQPGDAIALHLTIGTRVMTGAEHHELFYLFGHTIDDAIEDQGAHD